MSGGAGAGRIRVGLIGMGSWAREAYLPALDGQSGVDVMAVAARTRATRDEARHRFGPNVELYPGYAELLDGSNVDAVMIGLPPELTAEAVATAVEAGVHIFVEPPFAAAGETEAALEAAEGSGRVFHADTELRYLPVVDAVRGLVAAGGAGRPLLVRVELSNDWAAKGALGPPFMGSLAFSLGVWYLDVVMAVVEARAERADLFGSYPPGSSAMQIGTATVQFDGGTVGEWAFNQCSGADLALRLKVVGSEGEVEADLIEGSLRHRGLGGEWRHDRADCARPAFGFVGMRESVDAFLASVRAGSPSGPGAAEYRRLHAVLSALLLSEREKRSVQV